MTILRFTIGNMKTTFYKILYKNKEVVYVGVTTRPITERFREHIISKGLNENYLVIEFDCIEHPALTSLEIYYEERKKVVELEQRYIKEELQRGSHLLNISAGGEWGAQIIEKLRKEEFRKRFGSYDGYKEYKKNIDKRKNKVRGWLRNWVRHQNERSTKVWIRNWVAHRGMNKVRTWIRNWVAHRSVNEVKIWISNWVKNSKSNNKVKIWISNWVSGRSVNKAKAWVKNWVIVRSKNKSKGWLYHWIERQSTTKTKIWMRHWVQHRGENKIKIWVRNWTYNKNNFDNSYVK